MKLTEKQKNCPYCHGKIPLRSANNDYQRLVIDDGNQAMEYEECVVKGTYMTEHGAEPNFGWKAVPFVINYCPVCGRRFNDETN